MQLCEIEAHDIVVYPEYAGARDIKNTRHVLHTLLVWYAMSRASKKT